MATKPIDNGEKRSARRASTGRKQARRRADKTAQEQRNAPKIATIVRVSGDDAQVYDQCAKEIPGWDKLAEHTRQDVARMMRRFWTYPLAPMTVCETIDGARSIGPPEDANVTLYALRLIETMGCTSDDFANVRLNDIVRHCNATCGDKVSGKDVSAALAFMRGAEPTDTVQSTLALQMAATHDSALRALNRLNRAEYLEHAQLYGNLANKLLNTYTRQAEALAKLQRGGEQVIKHVHIDNRGGQAVVADQVVTGGQNGKSGQQPHADIAALPCADPLGDGVPIPCDPGQEAVQAAWRAIDGSAEG